LRRSGGGRNSRLTLEHDDSVSEIGCHDEIVLDDESDTALAIDIKYTDKSTLDTEPDNMLH